MKELKRIPEAPEFKAVSGPPNSAKPGDAKITRHRSLLQTGQSLKLSGQMKHSHMWTGAWLVTEKSAGPVGSTSTTWKKETPNVTASRTTEMPKGVGQDPHSAPFHEEVSLCLQWRFSPSPQAPKGLGEP